MAKPELKSEAIRLRVEERLSLETIRKRLGVSQGSCSLWLRGFPLTKEEIAERNSGPKPRGEKSSNYKPRGEISKFYREILDNNQKGRIAEAAISFRLPLQGWEAYRADGARYDFVVGINGKLKTLQVRWARLTRKTGLPFAKLTRSNGRGGSKLFTVGDFDFVAVYNLYNDIAYVFAADEVIGKYEVIVKTEAEERWDKLL